MRMVQLLAIVSKMRGHLTRAPDSKASAAAHIVVWPLSGASRSGANARDINCIARSYLSMKILLTLKVGPYIQASNSR